MWKASRGWKRSSFAARWIHRPRSRWTTCGRRPQQEDAAARPGRALQARASTTCISSAQVLPGCSPLRPCEYANHTAGAVFSHAGVHRGHRSAVCRPGFPVTGRTGTGVCRPWSVTSGCSCQPACPCGPPCARTSWPSTADPPPRPERSRSPRPSPALPGPNTPECALHRSALPDPMPAYSQLAENSCFHGWLHRTRLIGFAPPACTSLSGFNSNQIWKTAYVITCRRPPAAISRRSAGTIPCSPPLTLPATGSADQLALCGCTSGADKSMQKRPSGSELSLPLGRKVIRLLNRYVDGVGQRHLLSVRRNQIRHTAVSCWGDHKLSCLIGCNGNPVASVGRGPGRSCAEIGSATGSDASKAAAAKKQESDNHQPAESRGFFAEAQAKQAQAEHAGESNGTLVCLEAGNAAPPAHWW